MKNNRLRQVSLRLFEDDIETLKRIALERRVPYQVLIRTWVHERVERILKSNKKRRAL